MQKIYGYRQDDLIGLAEHIKNQKSTTLTQTFKDYAQKSGKAEGTVRNMYYALLKACKTDEELRKKYFDGLPPQVNEIVEFTDQEVKDLIRAVARAKKQGKSARSAITELSNGDIKTALRYQNKYRTALKNPTPLVLKTLEEINGDALSLTKSRVQSVVTDTQLNRLKREIDSLVEKLTRKNKTENEALKKRVAGLELENLRLKRLLGGYHLQLKTDDEMLS